MKSKAAKAKPKSAGRSKVAARVAKARAAAPARVKPKNPLLARWGAAFGLPPFKKIEPQHFKPAFAAALKEHKAEIAAIAGETAKPTFNNTIVALEKSGRLLERSRPSSSISPARTPTRRCRRSSARWRPSSPRTRPR